MNDMSQVIIPKSDQINADDLLAGPITITIREVKIRGGEEQPVSIYFEGSEKAFRPCKSMSRVLVQGWGADANKYLGRSLTLYCDPKVKWGGLEVGGIRISHMSDIVGEKLMMLTATKGQRKPFKVLPLVVAKGRADDDEQSLALKAITEAAANGTEALSNAWRQKWMAPHRDALALELERLKPVAAANDAPKIEVITPGPNDEPDPNTNDAADEPTSAEVTVFRLRKELIAAPDEETVERIAKAAEPHMPFLSDELGASLEVAIDKARQRVAAKEGVA